MNGSCSALFFASICLFFHFNWDFYRWNNKEHAKSKFNFYFFVWSCFISLVLRLAKKVNFISIEMYSTQRIKWFSTSLFCVSVCLNIMCPCLCVQCIREWIQSLKLNSIARRSQHKTSIGRLTITFNLENCQYANSTSFRWLCFAIVFVWFGNIGSANVDWTIIRKTPNTKIDYALLSLYLIWMEREWTK